MVKPKSTLSHGLRTRMKGQHAMFVLAIGTCLVTYMKLHKWMKPTLEPMPEPIPTSFADEQQPLLLETQAPTAAAPWKRLRIAVYMTTQQSASHLKYLEKCWPYATRQLPLMQHADLIYYYSTCTPIIKDEPCTPTENAKYVVSEPPNRLLEQLHFRNITAIPYDNPGYQMGAKKAMTDPFQHGWFDGYDWIVRLNPDVLIRDDSWILQQMSNTSVDVMFYKYIRQKVHSDFSVFRPRAANVTALLSLLNSTLDAEAHLGMGFQHVVEANRVAWIPYGKRVGLAARILGKKSFVIHEHKLVKHCPNYFNATGPNY